MKTTISILLLLSCQSIFSRTINSPIPPVELTSFTGQVENSYVNLLWTTATELNNKGFAVERAIQMGQWQEIYFIKGKGTTNEPQQYQFKDPLISVAAKKYYYRIKQIDFDGTFIYSDEIEIALNQIDAELLGNYPNPFNPSTKIKYTIPFVETHRDASLLVTLKVFDILGNEVATLVNEEQAPGVYEIEFSAKGGSASDGNASTLPSGVYLYQLRAGDYISVKKMLMIK